ncbi:MAG: bifunctional acetate--CoA ligase family protein/GNAT family N-acetyltransferase [Candidatus Protochlamydia sp.]|nr:bifunctional acetate--CoA ligase family protein/GNAT family N-acetyltransferase [Candidatus Protochlamydia sp.]
MQEERIDRTDPSQNFIHRYTQRLDALFHPSSVAVIGAKDTEGSVGRTIMNNLVHSSFKGRIYPVNPKREQVLGLKSFPSIASIPETVDLAIIVTPAQTVLELIKECVVAGVKTAIIISAGFKELGEAGEKLEEDIIIEARKGALSIIGPNCLGVMNPNAGLNATFAKGMALPGQVAFISQSGAMCTAVLDWSFQEKVGFSSFVSIGSMADVDWGTLIDYLGDDPQTRSLLIYMETVGDARSFMTAAREVALEKPIIVIKAGRSQEAAKAAASHTGSLAGSDEVFDAALERIGVLRVNSISELFSIASVLARQPLPKGPRLTIVTNAGGPAVLATDATVLNQAQLATLSPKVIEELDLILPSAWSRSNPIDILGDADPERYARTLEVLSRDDQTDGVLVILSPQDMTDAKKTAEQIVLFGHSDKPLLASWMGGQTVKEGAAILTEANVPVFGYPDEAARTFATMWQYSRNLRVLYETPAAALEWGEDQNSYDEAQKIISKAQTEGRTILTEFESKQMIDLYGIPVVQTYVAEEVNEAAEYADKIGYPVVLKLFSHEITHKTDVGGVKLNLQDSDQVKKAFFEIFESVAEKKGVQYFNGVTVQKMIRQGGYELILGSSTDPQFGPILLFGMGGQLVEVFKDSALALPPLNRNLARQMMQKTKIYEALLGVRGLKGVDMPLLEEILVRFSQMIVQNKRIKECDINPLLAGEEGVVALDARIVLHEAEIEDADLPKLAIRPYPLNYVMEIKLKNQKMAILRPIMPEDEPLIVHFHHELSENSVRQRYLEFISLDQRVAHERLLRICFNDYDREWAIVAEIVEGEEKKIIGIGRLSRLPGTPFSQFKMTIIDAYHHLGLGTQLLSHLVRIAREEKIQEIEAYILEENDGMLKICRNLGFELTSTKDQFIVRAVKKI